VQDLRPGVVVKGRLPGNTPIMRVILIALSVSLGCSSTQRPDGGKGLLTTEATVPDLEAPDHRGTEVALRDGRPSLVFFYPKNNTPGCTREACAFRDVWQKFEAAGVRVIGVSSDSAESHRNFAQKHGLPFSLIADQERRWATNFGVGQIFGMSKRVSFLIGPNGRVRKVYPDIDPGLHANEVLSDARALGVTVDR
jgi:thioredoxin-dependent peroxiredoxin